MNNIMKRGIFALAGIILFLGVFAVYANAQEVPRYAFYEQPMIYTSEHVSGQCYEKGEIMPILPDFQAQCCSGLQEISLVDESISSECMYLTGGALCSDCGNKKCEFGENICNCAEDCTKTNGKSYDKSAAECSNHVDDDGDGYCDYAVKNGYCIDGSHLGDSKCKNENSKETSCTPSPEICNGIDDDCNGKVDDNLVQTQACGSNTGECRQGTQTRKCVMGAWSNWGNCIGEKIPKKEISNGKDDNCDGRIDNGVEKAGILESIFSFFSRLFGG